jgi:hypothetical protein
VYLFDHKEPVLVDAVSVYAPSLQLPDGGYVRTFDATIDDHAAATFYVRGMLADHLSRVQHEWVLKVPEYEVVEATAQHLEGGSVLLDPALMERYANIQGVRIGRGFTHTIRTTLGNLPGAQVHLALAVEMARVGQQVYKLPKGYHEQFQLLARDVPSASSRLARMLWEQDRTYMSALANSCYAYRDASEALFAQREVVPFDPNVSQPEPGQKGLFWRHKRLHICSREGASGYHCHNEMNDSVHDIGVAFDLTPDGTICNASSQGLRMPYKGICDDAQATTAGLNGQTLGKDFMRVIADQVGGASGCTHLFDLSMDCLRFFRWYA